MDVKNLEELLTKKLGVDKKIKKLCTTKSPLQGCGSVMLKIGVTLENQNGTEELLHLVAKEIPHDEVTKRKFNVQVTFKKEVVFYEVIVPILRKFQKDQNVTFRLDFAQFYGARYNLHGKNDEVDENAKLLLEDLTVGGFTTGNHQEGFSLEMAETVLRDLARFHGTFMALKIIEPDIFSEKIKPHCTPFSFKENPTTVVALKVFRDLIESFDDCAHLAERATNFLEKATPTTCREPFGSVSHLDLWTNNIMHKIEADGTVRNVFVDFQLLGYRSPAADVFFFLWTSLGQKIIKEHLDHLLKYYHKNLLHTLSSFGIDTSKFDYNHFQEEIMLEADYEFGHALIFSFYLKVNYSMENLFKIDVKHLDPVVKEFVHFMVVECKKREWLP